MVYIYANIGGILMVNVTIYSTMDPMGNQSVFYLLGGYRKVMQIFENNSGLRVTAGGKGQAAWTLLIQAAHADKSY